MPLLTASGLGAGLPTLLLFPPARFRAAGGGLQRMMSGPEFCAPVTITY